MTQSEHWNHVERVFEEALEQPTAERETFLDQVCGNHPAVRDEVASLLRSSDRSGSFLETPVAPIEPAVLHGLGGTHEQGRDPLLDAELGRYRLIQRIGAGGMGVVYLGTRSAEDIHQQVAVKVVKRGMDTDEILRRFQIEQQVLAALDHPNIARLIDTGSTADGRPWYSMTYVEGQPITAACDAMRLDLDARLEIFLTVCDAVSYAHRNLVVHRDLKPSNILLDRNRKPTLLDFGIAKLLSPGADTTASHTAPTSRRWTPQYASPEQVRGQRTTTACDVYSLGVMLYELLTGCMPFPELQGRRNHPGERPPMTPPSEAAVTASALAARDTQARRLRSKLADDLDTIILKAMHPDPARRYPSVEALADDLRRHQGGMPVRARPDSLGYRLRKFLGRHRVSASVAAVATLAVLGLGITANFQARAAEAHAKNSERVAYALVEILSAFDPQIDQPLVAGEGAATPLQILDVVTDRLRKILKDLPWMRSYLFHAIGQLYQNHGAYAQAIELLEEARRLRLAAGGPKDVDAAATGVFLATARLKARQPVEAEALLRDALPILEKADSTKRTLRPHAHACLANALDAQGKMAEAERIYRTLLEWKDESVAMTESRRASTLNNLGVLLSRTGRAEEALTALRESLALRGKHVSEDHPEIADTAHNLGCVLLDLAKNREALGHITNAVRIRKGRLKWDHISLAKSHQALANAHLRLGNPQAALPAIQAARAAFERNLPADHWYLADTRSVEGECLTGTGAFEAAALCLEPSTARLRQEFGDGHVHARESMERLARLYDRTNRRKEAAELRRALAATPAQGH